MHFVVCDTSQQVEGNHFQNILKYGKHKIE